MAASIDHLHPALPEFVADDSALVARRAGRSRAVTRSAATNSTANHRQQANSDRYAGAEVMIEPSRPRRSASVATNTKRWLLRE